MTAKGHPLAVVNLAIQRSMGATLRAMGAVGMGVKAALMAFGARGRTGAGRLLLAAGGGAAGHEQGGGADEQGEQLHDIPFVWFSWLTKGF